MNSIPVGKNGKYQAWVDDVDFIWASRLRWSSCNWGGTMRPMIAGPKETIPFKQMGRFIAERMFGPLPADVMVDHRNGIPMDNRRENLRLATRSMNSRNRVVSRSRTNGLPLGVGLTANKKRFTARSQVALKGRYIGTYDSVAEASQVYQEHVAATLKADEILVLQRVKLWQGTLTCQVKP